MRYILVVDVDGPYGEFETAEDAALSAAMRLAHPLGSGGPSPWGQPVVAAYRDINDLLHDVYDEAGPFGPNRAEAERLRQQALERALRDYYDGKPWPPPLVMDDSEPRAPSRRFKRVIADGPALEAGPLIWFSEAVPYPAIEQVGAGTGEGIKEGAIPRQPRCVCRAAEYDTIHRSYCPRWTGG